MKSRLFSFLLLACLVGLPAGAAPFLEKIDLFKVGDMGYARFHIPGVLVTQKGTILAWCEARKDGHDWDEIDILLRRSTDDGKTWSKAVNIAEVDGPKEKNPFALRLSRTDPNTVTYNNPVLIADRDGTVHMVFCLEYMRCFYQCSKDDGLTWSKPVEITHVFEGFRKDYDWKVLATGPNHSIQLKNGRLVVPVWLSTATGGNAHRPSVTATIYSDDGGDTWKSSEIAVPCTEELINPNETVAVQLKDGRVMLNVRNESKAHRRLVVTSPDGATNWSKPRFQEDLLEPICMGGLVRYEHDGRSLLFFSNPDNLEVSKGKPTPGKSRDRKNGTIHVSTDEGESWSHSRTVEAGWSCYSDLGVTQAGTILCFYGRSEERHFAGDRLTMARLNIEWLEEEKKEAKVIDADVCVYGGTSGGVAAAVQAARMGKKTVLVEPGRHLGGMTSGGLSAVDIGEPRSVGGIAREYFTRLVANYGKELNWGEAFNSHGKGGPATGGAYSIEPHVAERVFDNLVEESGVILIREGRLKSVRKKGATIREIRLEDGRRVRAKVFLDTTYEGDLMAEAGVSYTVTREGNDQYGETLNGIHYNPRFMPREEFDQPRSNGRLPSGLGAWDRDFPLDPYVVKGDPKSGLLPLVNEGEPGVPGEAAPGIQAYCYRLCLSSDPGNRLPIEPPDDYDPRRYELVARFIEACVANGDDMDLRWFSKHDPLPNGKWDFNTATFGGNLPGLSWAWPEASLKEREQLARELENYHRGLFHFLRTDPRVPGKVKADLARFGLPADEFKDSGGWPHQVYIREGRRMVSDLVMTEHHTFGRQFVKHPVSLGSYGTDAHEIRRIVKDGVVTREGKIATGRGGFGPYQIGYGAIVPKRSECDNLLVTFALSASHSAFASIRMEPPFMITSQSAATAACHAIDQEVAVQDVDQEILQKQLLADAQILKWTAPSRNTRIKLAGIVLDDSAATFEGEWTVSSASGPLVGRSYKHDGNRRSRVQTATFTPEIPEDGFYQVSLLYTSHENRSSKARVKVEAADQSGLYLVNQKKPVLVEGHPRSLGVFKFLRGRKGRVIVSNEGSDGIVNVDGLQLVPVQP